MNEDTHINGAVSALVMLAAIASTFNVYSFYSDDKVASNYEEEQVSLDQTASALLALKLEKANMVVATTTPSSTETKSKTR